MCMKTILIIDGSNLLCQMFFGMPSRIVNKRGKAIQGTLGFIAALIKIIKRTQPSNVLVVFDAEKENERCELLPDYKANRPDLSDTPEEENPFSQLPDVLTCLDFMGIKYTEATAFEADDVIASYAIRYGEENKIYISSWDSDFFQLINNNVNIIRYRGENTVTCDAQYIQDKFGISPIVYADFKSLTGDTADNIKGVPKVGFKTATMLINKYGSLKSVIDNADNIEKPSIKKSIIENIDRLKINYELIKLTDKVKLPFELNDFEYSYNGISSTSVLVGVGLK